MYYTSVNTVRETRLMSKAEIIRILKDFKKTRANDYGIVEIGIFGSVARGEDTRASDIDIVVRMARQDLFNIIGIKQELEEILHNQVDIISYREKMNLLLKKRIDRDAIYV